MKIILVVTLLINFAFSEGFISDFEYGQMLYKDPRGVSCASCHGKLGEKTFIVSYKDDNGSKREFYAPDIRNLNYEKFKKALEKGGKIMPRYYLTNKEMETIYKYVKTVNQDINSTQVAEDNATIDENITDDNISLDDAFDDNSSEVEENDSIISKIFKTKEDEEGEDLQ